MAENGGACADGRGLAAAAAIAVSPDGRGTYVASFTSDAVAIFDRAVPAYDIDGDGQNEPLTDALLLLRYLFGFRGAVLVTGAVDLVNCTRCTAAVIEPYIESLAVALSGRSRAPANAQSVSRRAPSAAPTAKAARPWYLPRPPLAEAAHLGDRLEVGVVVEEQQIVLDRDLARCSS